VSITSPAANVGDLLRAWRQRRRLSQLDLAGDAEVSARHLSFVETGRSRPSRELLLHLAEHLDVPLRDRNTMLLAAGYAPLYAERSLEADELQPVRDALQKVLAGHEPFPAVVVDRHWDLVAANDVAANLLASRVAPDLLQAPLNTLRASLHPDGLAPHILNLPQYAAHLIARLDRQAAAAQDNELRALSRELRSYPGVPSGVIDHPDIVGRLFVPLVLRTEGEPLTFFSTIATFGTALDVTVAELAIEQFFPADTPTAEALRKNVARQK